MTLNDGAQFVTTSTVTINSNVENAVEMRLVPPIRTADTNPGGYWTSAISTDGALWAWGQAISGQCGPIGAPYNQANPYLLDAASDWTTVCAGTQSGYALKSDGSLWSWGGNGYGQLGLGDKINRTAVVRVQPGFTWKSVAAGNGHAVAIRSDGTLWAWGSNGYGQIGPIGSSDSSVPVQVMAGTFDRVAAGGDSSYAIRSDGTLWTWGNNQYGQLSAGVTFASRSTPAQVAGTWASISAGPENLGAIDASGNLWMCGTNSSYQCGQGSTTGAPITSLTKVTLLPGIAWVEMGSAHVIARKTDGTVWVWGGNGNGQLGLGDATLRATPTALAPGRSFDEVRASGASILVRAGVELLAAGFNGSYQYGDGTNVQRSALGTVGAGWEPYSAARACSIVSGDGTQTVCVTYRSVVGSSAVLSDSIIRDATAPTGQASFNGGDGYSATSSVLLVSNVTGATQMRIGGGAWRSFAETLPYEIPATDGLQSVLVEYSDEASNTISNTANITLDRVAPTGTMLINGGASRTRNRSVRLDFTVPGTTAMRPTSYGAWQQMSIGGNLLVGLRSDGTFWGTGPSTGGAVGDGTFAAHLSFAQAIDSSSSPWAQVGAGSDHTLAVRQDGSLWASGRNSYGQLGDGTTTSSATPRRIGNASDWKRVYPCASSSFALKNDGSLWAWGYNGSGQLGVGGVTNRFTPTRVGTATDYFKDFAGGSPSSQGLAIKTDGSLWAWGNNYYGELGDGTKYQQQTPVRIGTATDWKSVAVGYGFSGAIKNDGSLWTWGQNNYGALGDGTVTRLSPALMGSDLDWKSVQFYSNSAVAIKTDGSLWAWGQNDKGQLADWTKVNRPYPSRVGTRNDWTWAGLGGTGVSGNVTGAGLTSDGLLWCWGSNGGLFGTGNSWPDTSHPVSGDWLAYTTPPPTTLPVGDGLKQVTYVMRDNAGNESTVSASIILDTAMPTGTVNVNGGATYATSGSITVTNSVGWASSMRLGPPITSIYAADRKVIAVGADGVRYGSGYNFEGCMGPVSVNTRIDGLKPTGRGWSSAAVGDSHGLYIAQDRSLWAVGSNGWGQLGIGSWVSTDTAQRVGTASDWIEVAAGGSSSGGYGMSYGIRADGSLWAWGYNGCYALGDGSYTNRTAPVQIGSGFKHVSAGLQYATAVKTDGSLYAWGYNNNGQLGDGTTSIRTSVTRIGTANDWAWVAAGKDHTLGLKTDGSLWTWGYNHRGQLGDYSYSTRTSPVQIATGVARIAAGNGFSACIKTDGTLWTWGNNDYYQLADSSVSYRNAPAQVGSVTDWTAVSLGTDSGYATRADGILCSWGSNGNAQLGDGTYAQRATPGTTLLPGWTTYFPSFSQTAAFPDGASSVWVGFRDYAGNYLYLSDDIIFDSTAPATSLSGWSSGWTRVPQTISLGATDSVSGVSATAYSINGAAAQMYTAPLAFSTEGTTTLAYRAIDRAGNSETTKTVNVLVDLGPPATTSNLTGSWSNTATVRLNPTDSVSGVSATYYRVGSGAVETYTAPFSAPEGVTSVSYWSADRAGNSEATTSITARIDLQAPVTTCSVVPAGWQSHEVTVTLSAGDSGAGVAATKFTIDGQAEQVYSGPFTIGDGDHTLRYWSEDGAGNAELQQTETVLVDTTGPLTTTSADGVWHSGPIIVSLSSTDARSGLAGTYYSINGGSQLSYLSPVTFADEGVTDFDYWSVDAMGNVEPTRSAQVKIDYTHPDTTISGVPGAASPVAVSLSLAAADAGSGVAKTYYRLNSGQRRPYVSGQTNIVIAASGTTTIEYWSTDAVGNTEPAGTAEVHIEYPTAISPTSANPSCVGCHSSATGPRRVRLNFAVTDVDRSSACPKCHVPSLAGTHPYHNATGNCGAVCHAAKVRSPAWGDSLVANVPTYLDTYGAFASASSQNMSSNQLHIIHSTPRWAAGIDTADSKCGSCHAAAACEACHEAPLDDTHATHASTLASATPWAGQTGSGVIGGDQSIDSHVTGASVRCGTSACHNTTGVAASAAGLQDDTSHPASPAYGYLANTVTKTPSASTTYWKNQTASVYTMGQEARSNYMNATLSVPFTGEQVVLVADRDPYRGIAEVRIDGVPTATVDLYADTTRSQVEVFRSARLSPGAHTITVRVTGTKNPAARATYITVDQFKVYTFEPRRVSPQCTGCHPDRVSEHGYGNADHVADVGDEIEPLSGAKCSACHSMDLMTEHERVGSSSNGGSCITCHEAPRKSFASWNQGCQQGGCHTPETEQERHAGLPGAHDVTTAATCTKNCHEAVVPLEHTKAAAGRTPVTCVGCHTSPEYAAGVRAVAWDKTCVGCHASAHAPSVADQSGCLECHGTTAGTIDAIAGTGTYARTGGDHETGWSASAHGSAVPAGSDGGQPTTITCEACHNHNAIARGRTTELRVYGRDAPQSALCFECHSASGAETRTATPNTWNGRDVAAEFSRTSHHPATGLDTVGAPSGTTVTVFAQTTDAEFDVDSKFQMATPSVGGAKILYDTHTAVPDVRRLMFWSVGWSTSFDQYDLTAGLWNSGGFNPPDPGVTTGFWGWNSVVVTNTIVFAPGQGGNARYRYTPSLDGSSDGTWTAMSNSPFAQNVGGEAVLDVAHDRVYYFGGRSANYATWRPSNNAWTTASTARDATGTALSFGHGSGQAYSPEADRLYAVKADQYTGDGNGHLYYLASPSTVVGDPVFVDTGIQVTAVGPYSPAQTFSRMERISRGGHDYLVYMGPRPDGTYDLTVIGDLSAATPTVRTKNAYPWLMSEQYGGNLEWDGADKLYGSGMTTSGGTIKSIAIPDNPLEDAWGPWSNLASPRTSNSGPISFLDASSRPYSVTGYYSLGRLSADVDRPPAAQSWGTLEWDSVAPASTAVRMGLQGTSNGADWVDVPGFTSLATSPADLGSIPIGDYTELRLVASLSTIDINATPTLRSWSLTAKVAGPEGQASLACANCHNAHIAEKGSGAVWDAARVADPTDTSVSLANAADSSLTGFCLDCHTAAKVRRSFTLGSLVPYGVAFRDLTVGGALFPGWDKNSGTTSFRSSGHYTTSGTKALCENCHDPHGSNNANLLAWTAPAGYTAGSPGARDNTSTAAAEENLCLQCHGNGVLGSHAPGAQDIATTLSAVYRHDQAPTGAHSDTETVSDLTARRHAECVDCHDPHSARAGVHAAGSNLGKVLIGATAVTPRWSGTPGESATSLTPTRITGKGSDSEALVCFKCHSSRRPVTRGDGSTYTSTDLTKEFNPNNASYHNALGLSVGMRSAFSLAGTAFTWNPPAESAFLRPGWHYDSTVTCSDCHTSGSMSAAKGPHGSSVQYLLDPAYPEDWSSAQLDRDFASGIKNDKPIICSKCHTLQNSNSVHNEWGLGGRQPHGYGGCSGCHIAIPHGWKRPRLLAYSSDPAPYSRILDDGYRIWGIQAVTMRSHSSNDWVVDDCQAGCTSYLGHRTPKANTMP